MKRLFGWFNSRTALLSIGVTVAAPMASAQTYNTQRGATFGGITGAIAGAIIGENNDEAGAGAAIGGVLGAVAGGVLGNASDKENAARQQYYRPQTTYVQPQTVYAAPPSGAVSFNDVVTMSRSGVGEGVIMNQIHTRGVQRQPQVSDIISLHQQGVSENVIAAMQQARVGDVGYAPTTVIAQPVIVEQAPVYYRPAPVYRARPIYHHHGW